MRGVWTSLESHFPYIYPPKKREPIHIEDRNLKFEKQCIREYVEYLKLLSELL